MKNSLLQGWALAALWATTSGAAAREPDEVVSPPSRSAQQPLTLMEVLNVVEQTHPSLEQAERNVDAAKGKQFAAAGGWDPKLSLEGNLVPLGYYETDQLKAKLKQATPLWGIGLHVGYRRGTGDWPVYKGEYETLSNGEISAGVDVPIWRDGPIDARRAGVQRSDALAEAAGCARQATHLHLQMEAAHAYWAWVYAGQAVRIQRSLLEVAQERDTRLHVQVEMGNLPAVTVVDNERLVLDRESKWVAAQQKFQEATLGLSLFLRDSAMRTVEVSPERLPETIPELAMPPLGEEETDIAQAHRLRPELCVMRQEREAVDVDVRLADNQRAPALNAKAYVARDFGDGPDSLRPTEVGVGVSFEMPLALRKARGQYRVAQAKAGQLAAKYRALRDKIAVEVRKARVKLQAAATQVDIARRQVVAANTLAEAERAKFDQGASNLVIVNLRELSAADAAQLEVEARASLQEAWVGYLTVIGKGLKP